RAKGSFSIAGIHNGSGNISQSRCQQILTSSNLSREVYVGLGFFLAALVRGAGTRYPGMALPMGDCCNITSRVLRSSSGAAVLLQQPAGISSAGLLTTQT